MVKKRVLPNKVLLPEVERILKAGSCVTLRTKGGSMLPFMHGGRDSIVLTGKFSPNIGDIVFARISDGYYVVHRIRKINGNIITLMGDGNLKGVEVCRMEDLCGKVITIVRNGKHINPYASSERWKANVWHKLLPVRKYLLAVYRRLFL